MIDLLERNLHLEHEDLNRETDTVVSPA